MRGRPDGFTLTDFNLLLHRVRFDKAIFTTMIETDWCGEFAPRTARAAQSRDGEANTATDAAAQEDATVANVGAVVGECQSGRKTRATGRD